MVRISWFPGATGSPVVLLGACVSFIPEVPVPATAPQGNPSFDTNLFVSNERQRYMEKAKFVSAESQMLNLKDGDDGEGFGICAETFFFLIAQE